MISKRNYHLLALALSGIFGTHCGTSVSNPAPSPSAAPIVASFTTTSGTAIGTTGSTDVPIDSAFSITFSTAMDTSTLTTTTLTLSCDSTSQTVTVAAAGNNGATITPSSSMPEGTSCVVTATTGIKSSGGVAMAAAATFTFTTASSAPTVTTLVQGSTTIATSGTTGVDRSTAFTLTFSEAMLASTVTTTTVTLTCSTSQTITVAQVTAGTTSTAYTVTPSSAMPASTECTFAVTAGATNADGVAATAKSFVFTTAAVSTPTVSLTGTLLSSGASTTIATSGTTDISGAIAAPLTMTFSTAMSNSTVTSGTVFECPDGTTLTPTLATSDNTIYTITPTSAFPQLTACVLNLANSIQDANGNALAATTFTYTTGCGTSDDFGNSSTLDSCWTASASAGSATISIASNVLNMSTSTDPGFSMGQEYKTFGSDNVTATVSIPTFSGIAANGDNCGIWLQDGSSGITGVMALVSIDGGDIKINNALIDGSSDELSASLGTGTSSTALAGTLFLRITQSGTTVTVSYRVGSSGAFTDMTSKSVTYGSTKKVALLINSDGTGTTNCQYADFTVSGATATGQYSN